MRLIAEKSFDRAGTTLEPGDPFEASPIESASLVYRRLARFAPKGDTPEKPKKKKPARSRRYKRADMEAESH